MKQKNCIFWVMAVLIAFAVLISIYFYPVNNYLAVHPILFLKNISFTTVLWQFQLLYFFS